MENGFVWLTLRSLGFANHRIQEQRMMIHRHKQRKFHHQVYPIKQKAITPVGFWTTISRTRSQQLWEEQLFCRTEQNIYVYVSIYLFKRGLVVIVPVPAVTEFNIHFLKMNTIFQFQFLFLCQKKSNFTIPCHPITINVVPPVLCIFSNYSMNS